MSGLTCYKVTDGSPFADQRVRQALNYAIDRDAIVKFLNGTAKPAYGLYPPGNPYFGAPELRYGYDPDKAKALLKAAGYGPDHRLKAKIMISTAGSGQMLPLPMNEIIQQQVRAVGIDLQFDVVEWGTMLVAKRSAPVGPGLAWRRRVEQQPRLCRSGGDVPLFQLGELFAQRHQLGPFLRSQGRRIADQRAAELRPQKAGRAIWRRRMGWSSTTRRGCLSCTTSTRAPCRQR